MESYENSSNRHHHDVIPIQYPKSKLQIDIPISTSLTRSLPTKKNTTKLYLPENINANSFPLKSLNKTIILDPNNKCDKVQISYTFIFIENKTKKTNTELLNPQTLRQKHILTTSINYRTTSYYQIHIILHINSTST